MLRLIGLLFVAVILGSSGLSHAATVRSDIFYFGVLPLCETAYVRQHVVDKIPAGYGDRLYQILDEDIKKKRANPAYQMRVWTPSTQLQVQIRFVDVNGPQAPKTISLLDYDDHSAGVATVTMGEEPATTVSFRHAIQFMIPIGFMKGSQNPVIGITGLNFQMLGVPTKTDAGEAIQPPNTVYTLWNGISSRLQRNVNRDFVPFLVDCGDVQGVPPS